VSKVLFRQTFGVEMEDVFREQINLLQMRGLVLQDAERVWMTDRGKHYASNVLKAFYTAANVNKPQPIGVELMAGHGLSMISVDPDRRIGLAE